MLGTHRKSACFELIRSGKRFPDGYFWQVELVSLLFKLTWYTHRGGHSDLKKDLLPFSLRLLLKEGIALIREQIPSFKSSSLEEGI